MAVYNTPSDSANTAVRAFLTRVGEYYLGHGFNTGSGRGKKLWESIKGDFDNCCAYCGKNDSKLQIEHVIMFNRTEYGLHHPGNIIPTCSNCNKREKDKDRNYLNWKEHLETICSLRNEAHLFQARFDRIVNNFKKYEYPALEEEEQSAICVIANFLYENTKSESEKSLNLYKELDKAFVHKAK